MPVRPQAPTAAPTLPAPTDRDTQQTPGETLVGFGKNLWDGSGSWFRGISRAGGQLLDTANGDGRDNRKAAHRANKIIIGALKQAAPIAGQYIQDNPGRVIGRMGTGAAAVYLSGPYKPAATAASILAASGDAVHAIRNGANSMDDIIQAVLGGESPVPPLENQPTDASGVPR